MVSVITLSNIISFEYVWKKAMTDDNDLQKDDQHSRMMHRPTQYFLGLEALSTFRLPDITWPDIHNYLSDIPSDFNKDKLKMQDFLTISLS